MRLTSRKLEGATVSALSCLMALLFMLTGCTPEPTKVDEKQAFIDSYCKGPPDLTVTFPEAEFAKAKELKEQKKLQTAEKLMMDKLEDARVSAAGTTQLGQYLVRLNNILFDEGKDQQAIKYGEIASKLFYQQPIDKRPIAPWFVNIHSYLGMSYERMGRWADAEKEFIKAISKASSAPRAEVSDAWIQLLYQRLSACYKAQKKNEQAARVMDELKKLKR